MLEFFQTHGPFLAYVILFLGACVEGESIVLTASFLAYTGYLSLPWVMGIAFTATLTADQSLFYIGRFYGPGILNKRPKLKEKAEKVFRLLHKYKILFILGFRFVYGIRTASPLIIGTSGLSPKIFTIWNVIAAVIWTVISCYGGYTLGYFFADDLEALIETFGTYQKQALLLIGGLLALIALIIYLIRKRRSALARNKD